MTKTTYSFTCPCCGKSQTSHKKDDIKLFARPKFLGTQDILFLCFGCSTKSNNELAITQDTPINKVTEVTVLTCDCSGCNSALQYTDEPIACGFPPGHFWAKARVLPERKDDHQPGLDRAVKKDVCPTCILKALTGSTA